MSTLFRLLFTAWGVWIAWRLIRRSMPTPGPDGSRSFSVGKILSLAFGLWIGYRVLLSMHALPLGNLALVLCIALGAIVFFRRKQEEEDPQAEPPLTRDERITSARIRLEGMTEQSSGRLQQLEHIAQIQQKTLSNAKGEDALDLARINLERTRAQITEWIAYQTGLKALHERFDSASKNPSSTVFERAVGGIAGLGDLPDSLPAIRRISEMLDPSGSDLGPGRE